MIKKKLTINNTNLWIKRNIREWLPADKEKNEG